MSKRRFTPSERFSIFSTHGEQCYLCSLPLDLKTMEVDHVIPESLIEEPEELQGILSNLGLPADFEINSFSNWLPACRACNGKKNDHVFSPSPMIQLVLEKTKKKAPEAARVAAEIVSDKKIANALNTLERSCENEKLDKETLDVLNSILLKHRQPELFGKPMHFTPSYASVQQPEWKIKQNGSVGTLETYNKSTGVTTSTRSFLMDPHSDYEYNPVTGVILSKPKGLGS